MKIKKIKILCLYVSLSVVQGAFGQGPSLSGGKTAKVAPRKPIEAKARPTHEAILKTTSQKGELKMKEASEKDLKNVPTKKISYQSVMLNSNGVSTRIPAGALIHVPESFKKRVGDKMTGKLVSWSQFYAKNRSVIQLYPVNIRQARGMEKIKPEVVKQFRSSSKIVIGTHSGGLITVSPEALKPEEKEKSPK